MLIRGRRGITRFQIVLAGALGVLGGVYIWKPLFEKYANQDQKVLKEEQSKEEMKDTAQKQ